MTVAAKEGDGKACLAVGMDDYRAKPIKVKELLEKLLTYGNSMHFPDPSPATFDYGVALTSSDPETIKCIAASFLDNWPGGIANLRKGLSERGSTLIERTAHNLRSVLLCFASEPAVRVAAGLEERARLYRLKGMSGEIDLPEREFRLLGSHLKRLQ